MSNKIKKNKKNNNFRCTVLGTRQLPDSQRTMVSRESKRRVGGGWGTMRTNIQSMACKCTQTLRPFQHIVSSHAFARGVLNREVCVCALVQWLPVLLHSLSAHCSAESYTYVFCFPCVSSLPLAWGWKSSPAQDNIFGMTISAEQSANGLLRCRLTVK